MKNPVSYFGIIYPDAVPLKRFYADLFGWRVDTANAQYGVFGTGGAGGIEGGVGADQGGGRRVSVYARIDDLQGYLDEVGRLDGKLVMPPTKSGELSFVHLADAAGTVIGIYTD